MSTWHQDMAGRPPAPKQWCIECDPPNGLRTRMSFPSKDAAEACFAEWKAHGRADHCYVIGPPRDYESERAAIKKARGSP